MKRLDRALPAAHVVHRHAWLWEPLESEPGFVLRAMFGAKAVYLDGKIVLCFATGEEPWCGLLVPTDRSQHDALRAEFPALVVHSVLGKWLYLPESADTFERTATALVQLVRRRDPRIGVVPPAKKRRSARPKKTQLAPFAAMPPRFFKSSSDFRAWLEKNHATAAELWVGLYKKHAAHRGLTYLDAVLEALCFGWIDGVMRRIDDDTHVQRFTPRKPGSVWSNINVAHVERLTHEGRMAPAGLAAFAARTTAKTGIYSFEQKQPAEFPPALLRTFKANRAAWKFFSAQPPGYRRLATHRVVSAKQETTRQRRLEKLISASAASQRLE